MRFSVVRLHIITFNNRQRGGMDVTAVWKLEEVFVPAVARMTSRPADGGLVCPRGFSIFFKSSDPSNRYFTVIDFIYFFILFGNKIIFVKLICKSPDGVYYYMCCAVRVI